MSFLGQNLMILCEFQLYTCGISMAWDFLSHSLSVRLIVIHSLDPYGEVGI